MITIRPVTGMAEIRPGDDLIAEVLRCAPWLEDGDVLIVTSKIISKSEGRLVKVSGDADQREAIRQKAIDGETIRPVARRGTLRIVQTHNGLVLAAAGVDASNVQQDEIALLPLKPDVSAAALKAGILARAGLTVAVIISDSLGRPWRHGISDVAIGVAGLSAVTDVRGQVDGFGNHLIVTEVAVADELAAAGDLVKGKLGGVPIAVIRGMGVEDDGLGSSRLQRGTGQDLFRLGTAEAIAQGRAEAAGSTVTVPGLLADVLASLAAMAIPDGSQQAAIREGFYGLLAARPDGTRRACVPGHVTASTVLLDATFSRVLLTLHPRIGAWVQLGGHLEDSDVSLVAAAGREATEESGMTGIRLDAVPFSLDVHPLTCSLGLPTRHYDARFVARAPVGAEPVISAESTDLRWFDITELPAGIAPGVPEMIQRAVALAPSLQFGYLA
jgi:coenzyme F420-0:L-glutamate ligase